MGQQQPILLREADTTSGCVAATRTWLLFLSSWKTAILHTLLHKTAVICLYYQKEPTSKDVCPFLSTWLSYSGLEAALSKAGLCCFSFPGRAKPCPATRRLLVCGGAGVGGWCCCTTERQPSWWWARHCSPCKAHSTGAARSCLHPRETGNMGGRHEVTMEMVATKWFESYVKMGSGEAAVHTTVKPAP